MTAPPPLPSAGRADRARRAASTVDPSNPIRPGPRSCPRRAGHGQRPRPRTREPNGPRRCMWAISVPCALPDRIMRMGQWATCRTDHAAHAKAHVRAGIADHPDGPWTVQGMVPRTTLTDHGPFGGPTKYVVHAKAHAGTATRTTPGPWTGPDDGVPVHRATVQGPYGPVGGRTRFMRSMAREPIAIGQSHAHRAARPEPVPHPRQSTNRLPTVDVSPFGRSRHPPGPPCPASLRQPAPNKQRHNRHIREIKPDMKTSTQTDEKARHRNQKQRRQNQEPTQPATRYDAIRKPKKKHIPMQSPKEMDFLHPPPHGGRLSAERQRF